MKECYCKICYNNTEDFMLCDICNEHYCEECSYTYTLHYQFQGSRCYICSDQRRRSEIKKSEIRKNKIKLYLKNKN